MAVFLLSIQVICPEYGGHVSYDSRCKHLGRAPNRTNDVRAVTGEDLLEADDGDDEDEEANTKQ